MEVNKSKFLDQAALELDKVLAQEAVAEAKPDLSDVEVNRNLIKPKQKKEKQDFRLYPLFENTMAILTPCAETLVEFFVEDENGNLVYTEVATIVAKSSAENSELVKQAFEIYNENRHEPEQLRRAFIKEKVIQTRYTRRGAEYAQKFYELSEKFFALSTLVINLQLALKALIENNPTEEEVNE